MGWTSEGFYKNNSLTDNLLASSLQRLRVPFGEGAFLFQLHRQSPESQGWSLWVLIAFFPLFCQSAYSDEGKKGMKALQTLMKRSTNSFLFVDSPPAGRMSCGGGRGAWAALCLIGWLWGQRGEFGCFISQFGENKSVQLVRKDRNTEAGALLLRLHILLRFTFSFDALYEKKTNEDSCADFTLFWCFGPLSGARFFLVFHWGGSFLCWNVNSRSVIQTPEFLFDILNSQIVEILTFTREPGLYLMYKVFFMTCFAVFFPFTVKLQNRVNPHTLSR